MKRRCWPARGHDPEVSDAIATASDVPATARAFRAVIDAGRAGYLAGPGRVLDRGGEASSPLTGFLDEAVSDEVHA